MERPFPFLYLRLNGTPTAWYLDNKITNIVEKSNSADPGDDVEVCLSMELDEWRCRYELVSRWIDHLDSFFGFFVFAELSVFALYSFFYFQKILLFYLVIALHMQYDAFTLSDYALETEWLIGRSLLGGFPLGDHHILKLMLFCDLHFME